MMKWGQEKEGSRLLQQDDRRGGPLSRGRAQDELQGAGLLPAEEAGQAGEGAGTGDPQHRQRWVSVPCPILFIGMVIFLNNVILLQTKWESFEGGKISRKACLCSKLNLTIIHTINNFEP